MIRDDRRCAGEFKPAVVVWRAHHGNLDALIAQPSGPSCPFCFDRGPLFELEAEFAKELDRRFEVIDDDSTLSIRLSAMCPAYKASSGGATR